MIIKNFKSIMNGFKEFLDLICPFYPVKAIKTVRLRMEEAKHLLQDKELNLKGIFS